jgi:hypothetical protein
VGSARSQRHRPGARRARTGGPGGVGAGPALIAIGLVAGCRDAPPPPPADLAATLATATSADVASWRLDEATWRRIVVEPYRDLHPEYVAAFDAAAPALVGRLATRNPTDASSTAPSTIATRPHYAGDPDLTTGEAWARWALPVAFASEVATVDGRPLDAVFLRDRGRWYAIVGLDVVIRTRVAALDPSCAELLDAPDRRCRELAWQITDAALRTTPARFTRACALAANLCGKRSPP